MKPVLAETVEVEIPFHDLDPMDIAWHGNYFRYFEAARAGLLRRLGYDYPAMKASGYAWPIVETKVKFVRPARYGQRLRVRAELLEWENRLKIGYEVTDAGNGERVTSGYTIQCAVDANGELQLVSPAALRERVESLL